MVEGPELGQLEGLMEARFGLVCADWQREQLARAAERLRRDSDRPGATARDLPPGRLQALVAEIAVRETYFFRDPAQLEALVGVALPERARAGAPGRPIRILSAGCAGGEEPYSLALAVRERGGEQADRVWIHGIDLSRDAIERAREGLYDAWALRATPAAVRARCFREERGRFRLREEHRARVSFEERNLLEPDPVFWGEGCFDVIVCRNVTLYFSERAVREALARFATALPPGGFLCLGASETTRGLSDDFEPTWCGDAVLYRRRARAPLGAQAAGDLAAGSWIEQIGQACARVAALTGGPYGGADPEEHPPPSIRALRRLVAAERFEEGLALLRAAPADERERADLLLLEAVMLSGLGRVEEVERICARLCAAQGGNAGSRYLLGLCREHAGDPAGAALRYREAVRIDPGFAMAHLRLGMLARGAGDREAARAALREALARLRAGSEEHVILFGGGFSRAALGALCLAELGAAEGST